jgi:hypothetical protein
VRIVHFSTTRLAGAPIRLVRALQAHTEHEVRLVDSERWGQFEHDIVFEESPEEAAELAAQADVIHLHNYLDYSSRDFAPVDFEALRRQDKFFIRQFHSTPQTIATHKRIPVEEVLACEIPSLVIPHCAERYYPRARVVPNIVPQNDPAYTPGAERDGILFSPSVPTRAWVERWNTKGAPETIEVLARVGRATGCTVTTIQGRPLTEVLEAKRRALVVVDDLVTGSYHLSGLEGLSAGRPVLSFLDARISLVLRVLSGSDANPFVNVRLEEAEGVLVDLVSEPERARALGEDARAWIERYWRDSQLVEHFVEVYERPETIVRQEALRIDDETRFAAIVAPDVAWQERRDRALAARPLHVKAAERAGQGYRLLPLRWRLGLRRLLGRPT